MAYLRNRPSHGKEIYYILCILVVVFLTFISIWGPGGYLSLKRARQDMEDLRERVETLKRNNSERMDTIRALRSDPQALEKYAREKGYGKPGEIVQELPEQPPKDGKNGQP